MEQAFSPALFGHFDFCRMPLAGILVSMAGHNDPVRVAVHAIVYVVLYVIGINLFGPLLAWLGGFLVGITTTALLAAAFTNWLALRIFENRRLGDAGIRWSRASADNLALGLAGGAGQLC